MNSFTLVVRTIFAPRMKNHFQPRMKKIVNINNFIRPLKPPNQKKFEEQSHVHNYSSANKRF